jgi:IS30 family transposase
VDASLDRSCPISSFFGTPRGLEMANYKTFTVATNVKVYLCDPHSAWQRGTNENTNRLLRQ